MSRALSVALTTYLAGPMIALCNCCLLTRYDANGTAYSLGFTSLDMDVTVGGVLYEAGSSVDASDISAQEGSGVDNMSLIGLLSSNRILETDLEAGLWDGASVTLFQLPFEQLSLGTIVLLEGFLGDISHDGASYTAEVRSLSQRLAQQIVELTSNLCRAPEFLGPRCMPKGYNENGIADNTLQPEDFRYTANIAALGTNGNGFPYIDFGGPTVPVGGNLLADTLYSYGRVRMNTGLNQNIQREVKSHTIEIIAGPATVARLILQEQFPFVNAIGDNALLEVGCDRLFSFCRNVVKNAWNFQGEPFIPGNDAILVRGKK